MYCVWDCGGGWDGYSQPLHNGLDDATVSDFVAKLDSWKAHCYDLASRKTACLKRSSPESIRNAVQMAKRTEYLQVGCP